MLIHMDGAQSKFKAGGGAGWGISYVGSNTVYQTNNLGPGSAVFCWKSLAIEEIHNGAT
ncbi:MAG: hypothetical protein Aurels2KO_09820 [Aureliella sp.]